MSNDSIKTKRTGVIGVISDWDYLTTSKEENQDIPPSDHEYTINDLYLQLRTLIDTLNLEQLQRLEQLITIHINNGKNPHKTNLKNMGTSVLKELYNLWIENGHIGTEEVFLKQLFQYVKIADVETTLEGKALDEVPSVRAASELVKVHNDNEDAHEALFSAIFPGEEVKFFPTFAVHGFIGLQKYINVSRPGTMWFTNKFGKLEESAVNTLPADYSFGDPCFPIFGSNKNYLIQSENFASANWNVTHGTISKSSAIPNLRVFNDFAYYFTESQDSSPVEHILKPTDVINVTQGKTYTISIYVYPINRPCFGIRVSKSVVGSYGYVQFDLENQLTFISQGANSKAITGGITALTSGWYRVWMSIKATATGVLDPEFYPIDIYDGDSTYVGNGLAGACVFGAQVSDGIQISPYIPSLGSQGELAPTIVSTPTSEWYDPTMGTFVCEISNIPPLIPDATKEIYTFGDSNKHIALNAKFPTSHANRCYFSSYMDGNGALTTHWSVANTRKTAILVQSFNKTSMLYGYFGQEPTVVKLSQKVNPNVATLYLGCDRYTNNCMDGYLYRVEYYPHHCTEGNVHFFLGE